MERPRRASRWSTGTRHSPSASRCPVASGFSRTLLFGAEVAEVRHVGPERVVRRVLRVARDELLVVLLGIEIEGVLGIHVDELQVGLRHDELPETDAAAAE